MISFYPGPSKIFPAVEGYMRDAAKKGILSVNHRSSDFVKLSKETILLLKKRLNIPGDYTIFFTSSATECWEILAQSLISTRSFHLYNGAFGEKWFEYTQKIKPQSAGLSFSPEEELSVNTLRIPEDTELLCLVQNETSNGTQVSNKTIESIKKSYPQVLIAADATSSLAGVQLKIKNADIWLASVQKCFGLPAGLGLLICSPRAIERAAALNENMHYNSLPFMVEKMKDWQTSYTPNVLGIYLLHEVMKNSERISVIDETIRKRYEEWHTFLSGFREITPLIKNRSVQSYTVIPVLAEEPRIKKIKEAAKKEGLLLGNGYGRWSKNTFRIANFPALTEKEIQLLKKFLKKNFK